MKKQNGGNVVYLENATITKIFDNIHKETNIKNTKI